MSLYARGMSSRAIAGHLLDLCGLEVSPDLVSAVTDAVLDELATWQARLLEPVHPRVFFDALRVRSRDAGMARKKAVHFALGVRADGTKEILGLWLEQNEGAKFWLRVLNELRNRGIEDILLAAVDGLKGFPDAIGAAFPETAVQSCIVHLLPYRRGRAEAALSRLEQDRAGVEDAAPRVGHGQGAVRRDLRPALYESLGLTVSFNRPDAHGSPDTPRIPIPAVMRRIPRAARPPRQPASPLK